jgi:hypothetical protein
MARDFYVNGPTLVSVKGRSDSTIGTLSELGLSDAPIRVVPNFKHQGITVDAWGSAPPEVQFMLATVEVTISLVHFDPDVLNECLRLSTGSPAAAGRMPTAGTRMGNNVARFAVGNNFIGLNLSSPTQGAPWRFYYAFMTGPPVNFPLGAERSVAITNWTCIPYDTNLYNAGASSSGIYLWDRTLDN